MYWEAYWAAEDWAADEPHRWIEEFLLAEYVEATTEEQHPLEGLATLSSSGTPVFKTKRTVQEILDSIPGYMQTSGYSYHFLAADGEVIVFLEDWLSGSIPRALSKKYPWSPYAEHEVREYCLQIVVPRRDAITEVLEEDGFYLAIDEPLSCEGDYDEYALGEECKTRFAWVRD